MGRVDLEGAVERSMDGDLFLFFLAFGSGVLLLIMSVSEEAGFVEARERVPYYRRIERRL